jgi:ankyrin repeat protein
MLRSRSSSDIQALFRAVQCGDTEKVKRVWLDGLQLDSVDELGRTSLHVAVENAQLGVIELLLSADVETNVLDDSGRSPISIALDKRLFAIAEMLRAHQKAKLSLQTGNSTDADQRYVSHAFTAVKQGDLDELKRFVPDIVHADAQDYDLRTLLHIASAEGHLPIAQYLVASCGANVNLLDRWGTSPLSEAVDFAHNDIARFLIANHATESGNRAAIAVDHIDTTTLNVSLEYALRLVTKVSIYQIHLLSYKY